MLRVNDGPLGRGLRRPEGWQGEDPIVTVFNHDAWSGRIKHLVNEILEIERRLTSTVDPASAFNFDLHTLDYDRDEDTSQYAKKGEYDLARTELEAAIAAAPDYAIAYENLGDVHARLAAVNYEKAIARDPRNRTAPAKLKLARDVLAPAPAPATSAPPTPAPAASAPPPAPAK